MLRFEGGEGGYVDDRTAALFHHDRGDQARHAHHIEKHDIQSLVPVFVRYIQQAALGRMAGAVDDAIYPAVGFHGQVHQLPQVGFVRDGARHADASQFTCE